METLTLAPGSFLHGILLGWFMHLCGANRDVASAVNKAIARGVTWQQIVATILPLLVPAVVDILTGNQAALGQLIPQLIAAIASLFNPPTLAAV
jgi:hypothetical protein